MKKLALNKPPDNTIIKEKYAYEDFIVIDNYLVIRDFSNLIIYKFSKTSNESLDYFKEIKLKNQNSIKSMDAINPNNLFIVYVTNEIYAVDIEQSTQEEIKINMKDKKLLSSANEISIHDKCELKDTKNSIYIGFISVNNKDLYLSYKDWNNKSYTLNCSLIKSFKEEITHIEYKFINDENNKNYCFICILCKMEGHTFIAEVKEEYDLNKFISLLKVDSNWTLLFSESNILKYYYSFYYSPTSYEQNSIVIFTDQNKCIVSNFKKNLNDPNFLTKTEIIYKYDKANNNPIIGVNHYDKRLYITTKEDLSEFKLMTALTTATNTIKYSKALGILKTKIYDVPNFVSILFLTSKDILSFQLDLNEGTHKRVGSNVSLSALDNGSKGKNKEKEKNSDKESKGSKGSKASSKKSKDSRKKTKNDKEDKKSKKETNQKTFKRGSSFLKESDKLEKKNKKIVIRESLNQFASQKSKEEEKVDLKNAENKEKNDQIQEKVPDINLPKCEFCGNVVAKYRCSLCHKFLVCEQGEHNMQWERHKKTCPMLPKTRKIEHYTNLIAYEPLWNEQRRIIVEHLRKKEFSEAIEKNYILIQDNYNLLNQYEKELKILPFHDMQVIENNKKELLDSFLYYEDYFCNFLLLIHSFSLFKSKDEVWRLLNRLIKEMEEYNFTNVTNLLVEEKVERGDKIDDQGENYSTVKMSPAFEKIYLRILKILVTIAKYGNSLGEFSFYEKYLLDYVQKILEVYSKDEYINYNTYLLLGNLYVEYGFLQKGHFLYDTIIENNNNLSNKERLNDVVLCANYNSGLVNFVIDRYEMAKQRFETALKIKKEFLKEKNDLQISQIYETISEIDIEYKNYSSALVNINKAIESRELSNTSDEEFKLRSEELKNYIIQNSVDNKGELNSNVQFRRGENTEESENEKLVLDLIQDTSINLDHSPDIQELKKFFLFMTKLSIEQIDKLNEDQPKDDFEKNKRFPIVFSKNFKNSLTHSQRLALCDLKLTSLTRVNVLKNYTKKISIRNLNYNALNLVPPENNLNSIRNSYVTKTILHNWEARDEEALKRIQENQKDEDEYEEEEFDNDFKNKNRDVNNQNDTGKEIDIEGDKSTDRKKSKKDTRLFKEESSKEIESEENIEDSKEKKDFDYNSLLNSIKHYCEQNCKEKAKFVDNKFLFLLCREGEMTTEELKKIEKKPELIELLLDTYIDMVKESSNDEKDDDKQKKEEKKEKFIQPDTKGIDDEDIIHEFFKGEEDSEDNYSIPIPPPPPPPPPVVPIINN